MDDRRSFLVAGAALVAAGASARVAAAPQDSRMPGMAMGAMTLEQCVKDCLESHSMCLDTARYCMEKGGHHVSAAHLSLLLDCAEMCQTTANSLLRRSPQHAVVCEACARLCEACARDCDALAADEQMKTCAATCRECAQSCRHMAEMKM